MDQGKHIVQEDDYAQFVKKKKSIQNPFFILIPREGPIFPFIILKATLVGYNQVKWSTTSIAILVPGVKYAWIQEKRGCPAGCGHHCQY